MEDNLEEFEPVSEEELAHYKREAERLDRETDKAVLLSVGGLSFGDISTVPGMSVNYPRGIRDIEEWYVSVRSRRDYVYELFEGQCKIGLANLKRIHDAVSERVTAVFFSGTDFGMQTGPFLSPATYRDLWQPFHRRVNDWIHEHTGWKVFIHSCGSVRALYEDFIASGFDILNPVQTSAANMDSSELKGTLGDRVTVWGGGVDTQRTLPFGASDEVREQVRERIRIFGVGGGCVFNPVHNVQARVPIENVLAMYETVRESGGYPL